MSGAAWIGGWVGYLAALAAFGTYAIGRGRHRSWTRTGLLGGTLLGSAALLAMTWFLATDGASGIPLPRPWPTLVASPLPLAPLWSATAGLVFLSAGLIAWRADFGERLFYTIIPLLAGTGIFLWSGDGLILLASWEFISAVTYLGLVTTRRARPAWHAGWALLALSELGGILLLIALVLFMPLHGTVVQDSLAALARTAALRRLPGADTVVMILAIVAFGVKAGLFPVMVWMPLAEPEAPGVVAGIFSGLLTALAVSGILAVVRVAGSGLVWAEVLLGLGVLGALSGSLYSVVSRHVKRVLAYSTVEVLGLVFSALALWRILSDLDPGSVASSLALDGAVVLLVMHAGAKFVLFAVSDFTGRWSHTIDGLGGLIHRSGTVAMAALVAILALAAVPPLGGFFGEWLSLEAILKPLPSGEAAVHLGLMAAGGLLALALALGVLAYLRWYAFIFLGVHRGSRTAAPTVTPTYLVGLGLPLLLTLVSGPGAPWFIPRLGLMLGRFLTSSAPVVAPSFVHPETAAPLVPIGANLIPAPGASGTVLFPQAFNVGDPYVLFWVGVVAVLVVNAARTLVRRRHGERRVSPWTGGAEPWGARVSWSAEGFVHPVRLAFARFYGLKRERVDRRGARFYRHTIIYRLETHIYAPLLRLGIGLAAGLRRTQSGRLTQYLAYVWILALAGIVVGIVR